MLLYLYNTTLFLFVNRFFKNISYFSYLFSMILFSNRSKYISGLYNIVICTLIYDVGNRDVINHIADSLVKLFPYKNPGPGISSLTGVHISVHARKRLTHALGKT